MRKLPTVIALAFALSLALNLTAFAQGKVRNQVNSIIRSANLGPAKVGLFAVDVDTGEVLLSLNPDEPMMPASNMKVLTSAAAISRLGPDFEFRTELRVAADKEGKAVLIVRGDGDPSFGDPRGLDDQGRDIEAFLRDWVDIVKRTGLTEIAWLIVDDRIFDRDYVHADWPENQLHRWYCAPVAGLNFHTNCLDIYPRPTREGQTARLILSPKADFVNINNRARTGKEHSPTSDRRQGTNEFIIGGTVRHSNMPPISVTMHDPPTFFAQLLKERLEGAGIRVGQIGRPRFDGELPKGKLLHVHRAPLTTVLARCNKNSQNLFAESLLKRMGHDLTGSPGSWENGSAAMRIFLRDTLGSRSAAISIADGSGLSRQNRVSPHLMVDLLVAMQKDEKVAKPFRESLAISGEEGSLHHRLDESMHGKVYAKSGWISKVSGLSGYLVVPSPATGKHRTIAFSLLFNDYKPPMNNSRLKELQDKIVMLMDQAIGAERVVGVNR